MSRQLAFDLPVREALGREDFFVAPSNALALAAVDGWRSWNGGKLTLVGPAGSGKSHLAHVWSKEARARVVAASGLADADIPVLAAGGSVAVEDASSVAGTEELEKALFHLHNLVLQHQGRLLLTDRIAPRRWPIILPDLASRVQATPVAVLESPDDALLSAVVVKLFADRQIIVQPDLIPYLLRRMERSLDAARALVERLDARALADARPVTRALAATVLDEMLDTPPARNT